MSLCIGTTTYLILGTTLTARKSSGLPKETSWTSSWTQWMIRTHGEMIFQIETSRPLTESGRLLSTRKTNRINSLRLRSLTLFAVCRRVKILTRHMILMSLPLNGSPAKARRRLCPYRQHLNPSVAGFPVNGRNRRYIPIVFFLDTALSHVPGHEDRSCYSSRQDSP
jgi:hypothetical protein